MSLKEWKNNELNRNLMRKFGLLKEEKEITHMCALKVTHKKSGQIGHPIKHTLTESGYISHYTVEFQDVIVENIAVEDLHIVQESSHSHKRDDEKPHDKDKPIVKEEELEEAEKPDFPDVDGDGDKEEPISKAQQDKKEKEGGEKKEKDLSKVPPQLRKHMQSKKEGIEEEINLQEMDRREQYRADFERMMPDATPEEIDRALDDYMAPPTSKPKKRGHKFGEPGYGEFPTEPEEYTLKQGFKDVLGQAFSLEETLKRIAKAKNITLKSSGKKIK